MPFISNGFKALISSVLLPIFLLAACVPPVQPQTISDQTSTSTGSFNALAQQQKELVIEWHAEYEKITGTHVDPETSYDSLNPSVRTTFEAVTNALLKTQLTDEEGKSLGNALSLIKLIESVHGKIPDTRGDQQFRIYVLLADDALDKLYKCREFKRIGDNSVYHIGYPINFRQQGGVPSIQISVTRTGFRADIDVDYRSSSGPIALVNGHLTSANSDVRAGTNYVRHTKRWTGFGDWWRSLFGTTAHVPKADLAALSSQYIKPKVGDSEPVDAAAKDFFNSWLIEQRPQISLSYVSVKANACIAQFGAGETAREGMVRLRTYQHMKDINGRIGKVESLDDVLRGTVILGEGAQPVTQANGNIFSVSQIEDDVARALDCRKTQGLRLAEDLPHASRDYGHFYGVSTILRAKDHKGPGQLLYLIWTAKKNPGRSSAGTWRIPSNSLKSPKRSRQIRSSPALNRTWSVLNSPARLTGCCRHGLSTETSSMPPASSLRSPFLAPTSRSGQRSQAPLPLAPNCSNGSRKSLARCRMASISKPPFRTSTMTSARKSKSAIPTRIPTYWLRCPTIWRACRTALSAAPVWPSVGTRQPENPPSN